MRSKSGRPELILDNGKQVEMERSLCGRAMAGWQHGQDGERAAIGVRSRGFGNFAKELIRLRKAPLKDFFHLLPHFVTTGADGGAQRGEQRPGVRTVQPAHFPYGLLDDARQRSSPACVNRCHNPPFRVDQQHGQAIGRLHREEDAWLIGQKRIALRLGEAGQRIAS